MPISEEFGNLGTNADGSAYKGKLTVTKGGNDVYQFAWETGTNFIGTGVRMGGYLAAGLRELQERHEEIGDIRGMGLLRGIELVKDRETREPHHALGALTTRRCLDLGLSMNIRRRPERGSVWRIAPPLTVTTADIDLAMTIFDQALTEGKSELTKAPVVTGTPAQRAA